MSWVVFWETIGAFYLVVAPQNFLKPDLVAAVDIDMEVSDIAATLIGSQAQLVSLETQANLVAKSQEQQVALLDAIFESVIPVNYSGNGSLNAPESGKILNSAA